MEHAKNKRRLSNASQQKGESFDPRGDAATAINNAAIKVEATYETPYQAHAPMEPMNVIVSVEKITAVSGALHKTRMVCVLFLLKSLALKKRMLLSIIHLWVGHLAEGL
jgi:CO/xanthine dehydrogenase Mo-binding subunit